MRITLQRKEGTWSLSKMDDVHLKLLRQAIADTSYSQSPQGKERLYPKPLTDDEALIDEEFLEDWKDFVIDELEEKFSEDVRAVMRDLENVENVASEDQEAAATFFLKLPLSHAPSWFSTLNQARLMLAERYQFHDENEQFTLQPNGKILSEAAQHERFSAYLRYEFFCMIQEWIVRRAM